MKKIINCVLKVFGRLSGLFIRFTFLLKLYNRIYERLPYTLIKLSVKYIPLPKKDFIWTILLKNGKEIDTPVKCNDIKTLQFALSYQWHSPAINEIEWLICKNMPADAPWIDIGANLGLRSLIALSEGRPVYFFEPNNDLNELNGERCKLNNFKNYWLHAVGLSSQSGTATFYVDNSSYLSSLNEKHITDGNLDRKVTIQLDTLDSVFESSIHKFKTAFVKIDVEGHELAVIQGANRFIDEVEPVLLIEITEKGKNFEEIYSIMAGYGYSVFQVSYQKDSKYLKQVNQSSGFKEDFNKVKDFLFIKDTNIISKFDNLIQK